jgi:PilZ domain
MRVIKSDSGFLAFQKLFKSIQSNSSPVTVWQLTPSGERKISLSRLNSFHLESALIHFEMPTDMQIELGVPLYVYSEDAQFIFKTEIKDVKAMVFTALFPSEIKLLEEPDVTIVHGKTGVDLSGVWKTKRLQIEQDRKSDVMVVKSMRERSERDQEFLNNEFNPTLDEEDKMFADKRETPRARPKKDKFVKIKTLMSDEINTYKLFDLSQGGIAFITMEPSLYPKGDLIQIMGFEEFNLDDPLIARIMSHRNVDDTQIDFKIGCKFEEGQS